MTGREFVALLLLVLGCVLAITAGYGYGGWRLACAVGAVLLLGFGVLFALDSSPRSALQADDGDATQEEELGAEGEPDRMGGPWSGGGVTPAHPYGQDLEAS